MFKFESNKVSHAKIPWLTISLSVVILTVYYFYGAAAEGLVYQRDLVIRGDIKTILTSHFTHSGFNHLTFNVIAFSLIGTIIELKSRFILGMSILVGIIGINLWLILDSSMMYYCGFSGVLNCLFTVGMFMVWKETKHPFLIFVILGYIIKLLVEFISSDSIFVDMSWQSVPMAHIAGLISGVFIVLIIRMICKLTPY